MRTLRAALVVSASAAQMARLCAQTPLMHGWTSPIRCCCCLGMVLMCEQNEYIASFRDASVQQQDWQQQQQELIRCFAMSPAGKPAGCASSSVRGACARNIASSSGGACSQHASETGALRMFWWLVYHLEKRLHISLTINANSIIALRLEGHRPPSLMIAQVQLSHLKAITLPWPKIRVCHRSEAL